MPYSSHARLLQRAAELLGGTEELRRYLAVSAAQLAFWMQGRAKPPDRVFLKLADLIADSTNSTREQSDQT